VADTISGKNVVVGLSFLEHEDYVNIRRHVDEALNDSDAPLIRFRPWRYINLFTYLFIYLKTAILSSFGHCIVGTFTDKPIIIIIVFH